jgi:hypothetical protein
MRPFAARDDEIVYTEGTLEYYADEDEVEMFDEEGEEDYSD